MYRQGDILIVKSEVPDDANAVNHKILAKGEATGHVHRLDGNVQLYESRAGMFFNAEVAVPLVHEEHETIVIPEGSYKVIRQREFGEDFIRYVSD